MILYSYWCAQVANSIFEFIMIEYVMIHLLTSKGVTSAFHNDHICIKKPWRNTIVTDSNTQDYQPIKITLFNLDVIELYKSCYQGRWS